jgi:TonB family protein
LYPPAALHDAVAGIAARTTREGFAQSSEELAEQRLTLWRDQWMERQRRLHKQVTPALEVTARRLASRFLPPETALARAGMGSIGVSALLPRLYFPYEDEAFVARQAELEKLGIEAPTPPPMMVCLGACGQGHETASLVAVIDITHDASGRPVDWHVNQSSGDETFDQAALESVEQTTYWPATGDGILRERAPVPGQRSPRGDSTFDGHDGRRSLVPEWSRWAFSAQAYAWRRDELVLDPFFEPPGKEVESKSGFFGKTTMTRSVHLVAVRFRRAG